MYRKQSYNSINFLEQEYILYLNFTLNIKNTWWNILAIFLVFMTSAV